MKHLVRLFEDYSEQCIAQLYFDQPFMPHIGETIWVVRDDRDVGTPYKILDIEHHSFAPIVVNFDGSVKSGYYGGDTINTELLVELDQAKLDYWRGDDDHEG